MKKNIHYRKEFADSIKNDTKIHTIRRWQCLEGTKLNHIIYPYSSNRQTIMTNQCVSVQRICITPTAKSVRVDGKRLSAEQIKVLVNNDGFSSISTFWNEWKGARFRGYIIHWTNLRY